MYGLHCVSTVYTVQVLFTLFKNCLHCQRSAYIAKRTISIFQEVLKHCQRTVYIVQALFPVSDTVYIVEEQFRANTTS